MMPIQRLLPAQVLLLLLPMLVLLAVTWQLQGGFTYTLDDAYIHLRLAENLGLHGHYGINAGELSAPSSSMIWPLLLAPGAVFGTLSGWLPLLFTSLALALTLAVLLRWLHEMLPLPAALLLTLTLALTLNLYGLALSGMEHNLQILLVILVAIGIATPASALARWLHPALFLLPLVRYDSLAVTLPALLWLMLHGQARAALRTGLASLLLPLLFSLWLHAHDLGWLPTSVRYKSDFMNPNNSLWDSLTFNLWKNGLFDLSLLFLLLAALLAGEYRRLPTQPRLWLALLVLGLYILFGRSNSQGRYEIQIHAFVLLMLLSAWLHNCPRPRARSLGLMLTVVLAVQSSQLLCTLRAPLAARNIQAQQGQLARLNQDFLRQPVAVNDIGLVSWHSTLPVLDLVGLGSPEVLALRYRNPGNTRWMGPLMQAHGVHYAFIYDDWFLQRPANFIRVATLSLPQDARLIGPALPSVSLYGDSPEAAATLRQAILRYRQASTAKPLFRLETDNYQADTH